MSAMHNCSDCDYLTRTSPEQVFLLCGFWAAKEIPVKGASYERDRDYVVTHCHVQPEAPACPFFEPRKVSHGAASDSRPVPCAHRTA